MRCLEPISVVNFQHHQCTLYIFVHFVQELFKKPKLFAIVIVSTLIGLLSVLNYTFNFQFSTVKLYCTRVQQIVWREAFVCFQVFWICHASPPKRLFLLSTPVTSLSQQRQLTYGNLLKNLQLKTQQPASLHENINVPFF